MQVLGFGDFKQNISIIENSIKTEVSLHHQFSQHRLSGVQNLTHKPSLLSQVIAQVHEGSSGTPSACSAKLKDTVDQRHSFRLGKKWNKLYVWLLKRTQCLENYLLPDNTECVFGIGWEHVVISTGIMCPSSYFIYDTAHPDASPVASGQVHRYLGGLR